MKIFWTARRMAFLIIFIAFFAGMTQFPAPVQAQDSPATDILARVEVPDLLQDLGLPIYAHLRDSAGHDYALVIAPLKQITGAGFSFQILDDPACPAKYYLALERRKGARQAAAGLFTILHDDGRSILVKGSPEDAGKLSELGFDIKALRAKPMILQTPINLNLSPAQSTISQTTQKSAVSAISLAYDSRVAALINQVRRDTLYEETGNLSGENAVSISGSPYTITTRSTISGVPLQKASQYIYNRLSGMGLSVSFHDWSRYGYSNRNVVGVKTGKTKPTEIILMTAHLDDMPQSGAAPGADDNASGSAALLMAAGIMASSAFERTIRFAFFTGEEQGLFGSQAYSEEALAAGENIVAVYNMDMISWDSTGGPDLRLYTRPPSNPGYNADMAIASTFTNVVAAYGLSSLLTPIITSDGSGFSDHASFWDNGFAAILAIEDDINDFTPYYHTVNDKRQTLNMTYFTNFTKASVGVIAHLAGPLESPLPGGGSGGCFIATAAFGSPMARQVEILRQFRDLFLLTNHPGRTFVAWYYRTGPAAADYIKDKPLTRAAVRAFLYPLIGFSFLLISGYLPAVMMGMFLVTLLLFRFSLKTNRLNP